jgi:hypothetical protein
MSLTEYTQLVLSLEEEARKKVLAKTKQIERDMAQELQRVRPP